MWNSYHQIQTINTFLNIVKAWWQNVFYAWLIQTSNNANVRRCKTARAHRNATILYFSKRKCLHYNFNVKILKLYIVAKLHGMPQTVRHLQAPIRAPSWSQTRRRGACWRALLWTDPSLILHFTSISDDFSCYWMLNFIFLPTFHLLAGL